MYNSDYQKMLRDEIFEPIMTLTEKKANDYAKDGDTLSNFKEQSMIQSKLFQKKVRASDVAMQFMLVKLVRLANLRDKAPQNESIKDSIQDLINYTGLYYACRLDEVPVPTPTLQVPSLQDRENDDYWDSLGCEDGSKTPKPNIARNIASTKINTGEVCICPESRRMVETTIKEPHVTAEYCALCGKEF